MFIDEEQYVHGEFNKDSLFKLLMTMGDQKKIDDTLAFAETMFGISG